PELPLAGAILFDPGPDVLNRAAVEDPTKYHFAFRVFGRAVFLEGCIITIPGADESVEGLGLISQRGVRTSRLQSGYHIASWIIHNCPFSWFVVCEKQNAQISEANRRQGEETDELVFFLTHDYFFSLDFICVREANPEAIASTKLAA